MKVDLGLNAVIVAVTAEVPRILTVSRPGPSETAEDALPFGPLEPEKDRTLDLGLRRWVREQTGLELGYVEQLYTFGDRYRDPAETQGGPRGVSVAYLALVREVSVRRDARWRDWYEFFPWEDWRSGRPEVLARSIAPALDAWVESAADARVRQDRRQRAEIVFGLGGVGWDGERVLERYELLYEAYLLPEAWRDREETGGVYEAKRPAPASRPEPLPGRPMALDHRRILATALGRLRGKIKYRPVVFELLPPTFTLLQLQQVVEALAGVGLHKQNFRRLVENAGLVEGTGRQDAQTGGRPAELFVFRREVLRERPAPGVGLPGVRRG
ncbi:MAG: NUDIX hydrolase [Thermoanaerobaculia bacterium]